MSSEPTVIYGYRKGWRPIFSHCCIPSLSLEECRMNILNRELPYTYHNVSDHGEKEIILLPSASPSGCPNFKAGFLLHFKNVTSKTCCLASVDIPTILLPPRSHSDKRGRCFEITWVFSKSVCRTLASVCFTSCFLPNCSEMSAHRSFNFYLLSKPPSRPLSSR